MIPEMIIPRQPSDVTLLKRTKSDLRRWKLRWQEAMTARNVAAARAEHAERELAEWKTRFDILLRRDEPRVEISGEPYKPLK